ncbi:Metallo-dependent hydrolase [Aspergillus campestris IBT 28561]|uniref:Metallo-dependent hydrolase n=1 Tax=Aspergillus campestris (strain IBT 28561) TaxID=1392248 RepID=A0A2I1D2S9_ASPC2|nr:Metallo-dependent hydrolase [Aspergillus campestris IBT 28561]PKY04182.1 Metallo-dependent hydrolase [Aspergillus campestris IBT 28561]
MPPQLTPLHSLHNIRLPSSSTLSSTWDITFELNGRIKALTPTPTTNNTNTSQAQEPPLVLPALTHPHIHLDKAFIHNDPKYAHLAPTTGTFPEALTSTTTAKQSFEASDLLKRGSWLLAESLANGVTALRAFVEVDTTVQHLCLDAALTLKAHWAEACKMQLVCFAQDPVFSGAHGAENRKLIESALLRDGVDVLGSTPYVESDPEAAKRNIEWAVRTALAHNLHLDFHLDYTLDPGREPLVWTVLDVLRRCGWTGGRTRKRVMLGHCTRLTLFGEEWTRLAREIAEDELPVSFVGLPTSDLYMAAPPAGGGEEEGMATPRGTLQVPRLVREYGLDAVVGVNNVGNAFTPWGAADPLGLACLGVGVYQAGSRADAELLYECVSTRARAAIGMEEDGGDGVNVGVGDCADLLLIYARDDTGCDVVRPRNSVAEVVWDPPSRINRDVICGGRLKLSPWVSKLDGIYNYV